MKWEFLTLVSAVNVTYIELPSKRTKSSYTALNK